MKPTAIDMIAAERQCIHDGNRRSVTFPPDSKTLMQRSMTWCKECGKLLDDREWRIPLPAEIDRLQRQGGSVSGDPIQSDGPMRNPMRTPDRIDLLESQISNLTVENERLKKEVERIRKLSPWRSDLIDVCNERDALRASLEELKKVADEELRVARLHEISIRSVISLLESTLRYHEIKIPDYLIHP